MSSFNATVRAARDERLPSGRRYIAYRRALCAYAALRRASFQALDAQLAERFGFHADAHGPSPAQMVAALNHLADERALFLIRLRAYAGERRAAKRRGQRQPSAGPLAVIFPPRAGIASAAHP